MIFGNPIDSVLLNNRHLFVKILYVKILICKVLNNVLFVMFAVAECCDVGSAHACNRGAY